MCKNNSGERKKREKRIVWQDPVVNKLNVSIMSGLEFLNCIKEGTINPPPMAALVGYKIVEIKHGIAVFELNPEECHYNPFSTIHGELFPPFWIRQ